MSKIKNPNGKSWRKKKAIQILSSDSIKNYNKRNKETSSKDLNARQHENGHGFHTLKPSNREKVLKQM